MATAPFRARAIQFTQALVAEVSGGQELQNHGPGWCLTPMGLISFSKTTLHQQHDQPVEPLGRCYRVVDVRTASLRGNCKWLLAPPRIMLL